MAEVFAPNIGAMSNEKEWRRKLIQRSPLGADAVVAANRVPVGDHLSCDPKEEPLVHRRGHVTRSFGRARPSRERARLHPARPRALRRAADWSPVREDR